MDFILNLSFLRSLTHLLAILKKKTPVIVKQWILLFEFLSIQSKNPTSLWVSSAIPKPCINYVNKNTWGNFQNQVHSLIFVGIEEPFL